MIAWRNTDRGFRLGEFKDRYASDCSVQESSLVDGHDRCIWVGCNHETFDDNGLACGARMHLTREMAGQLAHVLLRFCYTGELP